MFRHKILRKSFVRIITKVTNSNTKEKNNLISGAKINNETLIN